jgi:hypothetical protein
MAVSSSFASKVASYLGAPPDRVLQILNQWQPYEGGSAAFNPLNTTQGGPGVVSNYNDVGVKNFANEDAGAAATAATLLNGYYPDIVKWMRTGELDTANVVKQLRTWGTVHFADAVGGGQSAPGESTMPTSDTLNKYAAAYAQLKPLQDKLAAYIGPDGKITPNVTLALNPQTGMFQALVKTYDAYGNLTGVTGKDVMSGPEYQQYQQLKSQVDSLATQAQAEQVDPATIIKVQQAIYGASDPAIAAENAAAKYARDTAATNAAMADARQRYGDQMTLQGNREKSFNQWAAGHQAGESSSIPSLYLPTQDDIFKKSLETIKALLPDPGGAPFYTPEQKAAIASASQPTVKSSLAAINAGIDSRSTGPATPAGGYNFPGATVTDTPTLPSGYGSTSGLGDSSSVSNAPITPSILNDPNVSVEGKLRTLGRLTLNPFSNWGGN